MVRSWKVAKTPEAPDIPANELPKSDYYWSEVEGIERKGRREGVK
jgi:hypothetical protein